LLGRNFPTVAAERHAEESWGQRFKRLCLVVLMVVAGLNVWTGSPLFALWLGSRVQGSGPPTMSAVFAFFAAFVGLSVLLVNVLGRLGRAYDDLTGHTPTVRRHVSWLRSMRAERPEHEGMRIRLSALEVVLVTMVLLAVIAFEIWFFFFAGSSLPAQ
jgi:hypothetical protein